jgi:hypothetical protein
MIGGNLMSNMGSYEQLKTVARNCYGYDGINQGFISKSGDELEKSCTNCKHLVNQKCEKHLYDNVAANLDEK